MGSSKGVFSLNNLFLETPFGSPDSYPSLNR